jgi:iron uptake system component EfeO
MPSVAGAGLPLGVGLVLLAGVGGCASNASPGTAPGAGVTTRTITVTSSADACRLSATTAPSGGLTFSVSNAGGDVTEFYLLRADGTVVGEVEDIGPGLSRDLVVQVMPGSYTAACKPGMTGEGVRQPFTVTDSGTPVPSLPSSTETDAS